MNDLLVVLNPRKIEECIEAIEALPIDKLWLTNYSEREIEERWDEVLELSSDYEWLWIISDDTIPRPAGLTAVRDVAGDGWPVVTGYCNLSEKDLRVNICDGPLGPAPAVDAYPWLSLSYVMTHKDAIIPTTFAGFCLTGMSLEDWTRFPYQLHNHGNSADFQLSKRLTEVRVPIVAARDGFAFHVKENWPHRDKDERKRLYVGVEPAEMRLERMAVAA